MGPKRPACAGLITDDRGDVRIDAVRDRPAGIVGNHVVVEHEPRADPIGGELSDAALSSLGWGGRLLLMGFVGGVQQIPANRLLVKNRSALGCSLRYYRWHAPDKLLRSVEELLRWYREGKLKPCVTHRLPLERSAEAIRLLTDRKAHGKVVVVPGLAG